MSQKTQGTALYVVNTLPSGGPVVVALGCPTNIAYSGAPASQIETTCLSETQARTYRAGLKTPGTATMSVDFDTSVAAHMTVWDLYNQPESVTTQWAIGFDDGTDAPTLDSNGLLQLPTTRSWLSFNGYVSDLPLTWALDAVVKSDVPVQISGAVSLTAAV